MMLCLCWLGILGGGMLEYPSGGVAFSLESLLRAAMLLLAEVFYCLWRFGEMVPLIVVVTYRSLSPPRFI